MSRPLKYTHSLPILTEAFLDQERWNSSEIRKIECAEIKETIRNDPFADYYAFVLNADGRNESNGNLDRAVLRNLRATEAMHDATQSTFPAVKKNTPVRKFWRRATAIIFVPCEKKNSFHLHGFIRVFRQSNSISERFVIFQDQQEVRIAGPIGLVNAVRAIKQRFGTRNLFVANRDGKAITEPQQGFASLDRYLAPSTRKETRHFEDVGREPPFVFKYLAGAPVEPGEVFQFPAPKRSKKKKAKRKRWDKPSTEPVFAAFSKSPLKPTSLQPRLRTVKEAA